MRLTFYGTKGEIEEEDKFHRQNSLILLETLGRRIILDAGSDWIGKLEDLEPDAILITHAHPDHAEGLKGYLGDALIFLSRDTSKLLKDGYPRHLFNIFRKDEEFRVNSIRVLPKSVLHSLKAPMTIFKIQTDAGWIVYSPDVLHIPNREEFLKDVVLYIGDGASLKRSLVRRKDGKIYGHASVKAQVSWLKKAKVKTAIFTHWGKEAVEMDERILRRIVAVMGEPELNAIVAHDTFEYRVGKVEKQEIMDRERYAKKLAQLRRRLERLTDADIRRLARLYEALAKRLKEIILTAPAWDVQHIRDIQAALSRAIRDAEPRLLAEIRAIMGDAWELGLRSVDEMAEFLGVTVVLPEIDPTKLAIMQDYSADLIRGVTSDLISKVNNAILRGIVGERTPFQLVEEIVPSVRMFVDPEKRKPGIFTTAFNRSEKIIRTEMHRVNQMANQARMEQLFEQRPELRKQWITTLDGRQRETHEAAHLQIRKIDRPFIVGKAKLMFPGDPAGPPEEVINCRCQSVILTPAVE